MLCRTLLVIIIAIALVVGLVRFVSWRVEVGQAEKTQNQLQAQYDFNPGNIISDGQFFNGNALSEAQVRSFIEEQGAACSGERCLKTMTFDTESQSANEYCEAYEGGKNESAAAIIYKSGKACGVSQKVLLTVLQKEQHLLTATDPSDFQYKSAMGLSCPDDANCDPEYAGFFKQVYGAAKRYQYYVQHEDDYGYHAGALNYIQYHPNAELRRHERVYRKQGDRTAVHLHAISAELRPHWRQGRRRRRLFVDMATVISPSSIRAGSAIRAARSSEREAAHEDRMQKVRHPSRSDDGPPRSNAYGRKREPPGNHSFGRYFFSSYGVTC